MANIFILTKKRYYQVIEKGAVEIRKKEINLNITVK